MCKEGFCRLRNFGLGHDDPTDFFRPLTGSRSILYVLYRWVFALYFLVIIIIDLSHLFKYVTGKWFIIVTHWSFIVLTVHTIVQAIMATDYNAHPLPASRGCCTDNTKMDWKTRIAWILNNLVISQAVLVVILYWVIVYDPDTFELNIANISTHSVNLGYVVLEFLISAIPVRVHHAYIIFLFGVVYTIFTVIYWKAGGTNNHGDPYIYTVLDYENDPGKAALWVVIIHVAVVVIHCVWSGLYQLKLLIYKKAGCIKHEWTPTPAQGKAEEVPMA